MIDISTLLGRYKDILVGDDEKKKRCSALIQESSGLHIDVKDISFKKNTVVIRANTVVKNELFMHKTRIISAFQSHGFADIFEIG